MAGSPGIGDRLLWHDTQRYFFIDVCLSHHSKRLLTFLHCSDVGVICVILHLTNKQINGQTQGIEFNAPP